MLPRLTDITKVQIRKETLIGLVTGQHNSHIALRISSTSLQQCWSSTLIIHLHEASRTNAELKFVVLRNIWTALNFYRIDTFCSIFTPAKIFAFTRIQYVRFFFPEIGRLNLLTNFESKQMYCYNQ